MLRLYRKLTAAEALAIDLAHNLGITPKAIHDFLTREAGGRATLGYVMEDQKTYLRSKGRKI